MSLWTLLLIAVGVSADAFAVAIGKGLAMRRLHWQPALRLGVAFGVAQAVMPLLGWLLGSQLAHDVTSIDHWVAFVLLGAVGGRMLRGAWGEHDAAVPGRIGWRELVVLAVATSIDALAVGISFAFLDVDIVGAAVLIGVTTLVLSLVGVVVGQRAGARFRGPAEAVGGVVLIGIGTRILLTHLAVI